MCRKPSVKLSGGSIIVCASLSAEERLHPRRHPPTARIHSRENKNCFSYILMSLYGHKVIRLGNGWNFLYTHTSLSQLLISSLNTFSALGGACGGPHKLSPPPNYFFIFYFLCAASNLKLSHLARLFFYFHTTAFFSPRAHTHTVQFRKRIEKIWTVIRVGNIIFVFVMVRPSVGNKRAADERAYNEAGLCNRSRGMHLVQRWCGSQLLSCAVTTKMQRLNWIPIPLKLSECLR